MLDQLVHPGKVRDDARRSARHRLPHAPRRGVGRGHRDADVGGLVPLDHLRVGNMADHVDAIRVSQRADRGMLRGHVLEDEPEVRQLVREELERVDDDARVVDRHQRPGAEDDASLREAQPRARRGAIAGRRAEMLELDAPAHEHHLGVPDSEVGHRVHERLRVRHRQRRAPQRDPVRQPLEPARPQHVGSPRHGDERLGARERREARETAQPVGMHDVRAQLSQQAPDPAHVRHRAAGAATLEAGRGERRHAFAGKDRGRQARNLVASHQDVEPALPHRQREMLHVGVVHRAEHQQRGAVIHVRRPSVDSPRAPRTAHASDRRVSPTH